MDYKQLLTDSLGLLQQVVRSVASRHRLRDHDAEELLGTIQLRLVENDYQILRQCKQPDRLRTYLTAVTTRQVLDERNARLGKWRPSVYAKRIGPVAVHLERLITRDGLGFNEAVQLLRTNHRVSESEEELYQISIGIPQRSPRRFVNEQALRNLPQLDVPELEMERERRGAIARKTEEALDAALTKLDTDDRLLLKMYFRENLGISSIARVLKVEQRPLYRRKDQVLAALALELARLGIEREEAREILGEELNIAMGEDDAPGNADVRPSI